MKKLRTKMSESFFFFIFIFFLQTSFWNKSTFYPFESVVIVIDIGQTVWFVNRNSFRMSIQSENPIDDNSFILILQIKISVAFSLNPFIWIFFFCAHFYKTCHLMQYKSFCPSACFSIIDFQGIVCSQSGCSDW